MMAETEFKKLKSDFISANTDKKIELYAGAVGLTQNQYKELLREFPYNEIGRLEKALQFKICSPFFKGWQIFFIVLL